MHGEAIADLDLGALGLWRPAAPGPFLRDTDRLDAIVDGVIAPGVRRATPAALAPACIVGKGRLGVGRTGKPAGFHAPDVLGETLSFLGLGGGIRPGGLVSQLA